MDSTSTPTESHARDHIMTAAGVIAEFIAGTYGTKWLAWIGCIFLFFAFLEYTKSYLSKQTMSWKYGLRGAMVLVLVFAALEMTGGLHRRNTRREPSSVPQITRMQQQSIPLDTKSAPVSSRPNPIQTAHRNSLPRATEAPHENRPIAIAPNGIANAAPNYGNQTVNNTPPPRPKWLLSSEEYSDLVRQLALLKGSASLSATTGNVESFGLASQLLNMFHDGGWTVANKENQVDSVMGFGPPEYGVSIGLIPDPSNPAIASDPSEVKLAELMKGVKSINMPVTIYRLGPSWPYPGSIAIGVKLRPPD